MRPPQKFDEIAACNVKQVPSDSAIPLDLVAKTMRTDKFNSFVTVRFCPFI